MRYKSTTLYKIAVASYIKLRVLWWNILIVWTCKYGVSRFYAANKNLQVRLLAWLLKRQNVIPMAIESHESYAKKFASRTIHTIVRERNGIVVSQVYDVDQLAEIQEVPMGNLYMATYQNLTIHGDSDVICDFDRHIVINDYAYSLDDKLEACANNVIKIQHKRCALVKVESCEETIREGILLCSTFSGNYYHVLYEILIKMLLLRKVAISSAIPLIIDNSIFQIPQFKEIFNILNVEQRAVICVDSRKYYKVNHVYYLSSVNLVPQQLIKQELIMLKNFAFDKNLLVEYRNILIQTKSNDVYPKRIYISRKGYNRRQYNEEELIKVVEKYGFKIVHPEHLSFSQQISLYSNADIVIGATGASFANTLFMKEGAYAICLMGENIMFPAFTIGTYISNANLIYVIGERTKVTTNRYSFQADFTISPEKLEYMLRKVISQIEDKQKIDN